MNKHRIVIHHSVSQMGATTFEMVNQWHVNRGWPKIGYHYLITGDGKIHQGRKEDEVGAHAKEDSANFNSLGICLTGNFELELPSRKQLQSLTELISDIKTRHEIRSIIGHKDISPTKCPGHNLYEWLQNYNLGDSPEDSMTPAEYKHIDEFITNIKNTVGSLSKEIRDATASKSEIKTLQSDISSLINKDGAITRKVIKNATETCMASGGMSEKEAAQKIINSLKETYNV